MSNILDTRAKRVGPSENGIVVISAAAGTIYAVDLYSFGNKDPSAAPLVITTSAGVLVYKYSNDPNATVTAVATSGVTRAFARSTLEGPFEEFPPKGFRYLILQNTVISTIRIHSAEDYVATDPMDLLHIYAEGDSNTALDAVSDGFAGQNRWWYNLQRLFANDGFTPKFVANVAQSGSQWTVGSGLAPNPIISATRQNALDNAANARMINVLLLMTSTNDILSLGDTLGTLQTNYRTWMDNRLAAGKNWLIVPVFIAAMQHSRNSGVTALNAWLPDLATPAESNRAFAVVAPRPTLLDNSSPTNQDPVTGYYAPNTNIANADHFNGNGGQLVAREIYRTLRAIPRASWPARP